ncbi:MAG: hypothetical protein V5A44_08790 [Haloarculaceae archaeon]
MRVLLTVALAVAVATVALPAIDAVGVERADTRTGAAVERLVTAARTLAAGNDALPPEQGPARQVVELDLPEGGVTSAPVASLTVGPPARERNDDGDGPGAAGATTRIAWRVAGGGPHVRQVAGLRIRSVTGEQFVTGGGRHRLSLRLVRREGRRVVTVATGP